MPNPEKASRPRSRPAQNPGSGGSATIQFGPAVLPRKGVFVVFCGPNLAFGQVSQKVLAPVADLVARAASADHFTGKNNSALELVMPAGTKLARLMVIGLGKEESPRD